MARRVILVVDDQALTRNVVSAMLEHDDVEVHTAHGAESALAAAAAFHPDVVLLDVNMPGGDGFSVCRSLRETYGPGSPRVVMLTGRADDEARAAAAEAGADAYLVKPFSAFDLLREIFEEPVRGA